MITIVDYEMGNVGSIKNMLRKIGVDAEVTGDPAEIGRAEKLILPGVGAFDQGMRKLKEKGLIELLNRRVQVDKVPTLGICLGMQLMTKRSDEGVEPGLGWIDADTVKFRLSPAEIKKYKVPHMGWNILDLKNESALYRGAGEEIRFYFVHSYHVDCRASEDVTATAWHGHDVTASFERGNIFGAQYHPEKSHRFGMKVLENFSEV